jgi:hypothetical protein
MATMLINITVKYSYRETRSSRLFLFKGGLK